MCTSKRKIAGTIERKVEIGQKLYSVATLHSVAPFEEIRKIRNSSRQFQRGNIKFLQERI